MIQPLQALSYVQTENPAWRVHEKVRLMRNGIINYAGNFVARLVGIVLVPFLLHNLGLELYGLWLAALAFSQTLSIFAVGLEWSVERAVAANSDAKSASIDLVRAAGTLSLMLGIVGGVIVAFAGRFLGTALHLPGSITDTMNAVFVVTGVTFVVDRLRLPYLSIANGARRFDLINLAAVGEALARGVGIIVLLRAGFGVIAIAVFHLGARSAGLLALSVIAARTSWRYALPFGSFSMKAVRHHLAFGFTTYAAFSILQVVWEVPPLLIGIVLGSAEIVTYHVALRFPNAVMLLGSRCGEVMFPEANRCNSKEWAHGVLESGTRWLIVLMLPLCAMLFVIAPQLLSVWLHVVPAGSVAILRIMAAAILIDAVAIAPQYVVFSGGEARLPFVVFSIEALLNVCLSVLFLSWLGITGAAWAILVTTGLRTCAMLTIVQRVGGHSVVELARNALRGLFPAFTACMLLAWQLAKSVEKPGWSTLLLTAAAAIIIYIVTLYLWGAREEELILIRNVFGSLWRLSHIHPERRGREGAYRRISQNLNANITVKLRLSAQAHAAYLSKDGRIGTLRRVVGKAGLWTGFQNECVTLPALLYHHVGPCRQGTHLSLTVEPLAFERQIRWLACHGYHGIAPCDWLMHCQKGIVLPEKPVLITFDDGYADLAEYALPVLQRYSFKAAVYVVTGQLDGINQWDVVRGSGAHRLMSQEQIRYWAERGIEFGVHTRSHESLVSVDNERLIEEVAGSGEDLYNMLGYFPKSFAYPYGFYNDSVCRCVGEYFALAFTCDEGLNDRDTDFCLLRRTMVKPQDSTIDLICRVRLGYSPIERIRRIIKLRTRARRFAVACGLKRVIFSR